MDPVFTSVPQFEQKYKYFNISYFTFCYDWYQPAANRNYSAILGTLQNNCRVPRMAK
jgi:hypothetical protein